MTLTPSYGRDYKSKKAIIAAFNENLDFTINDITSPWHGKPCNKKELKSEGIMEVWMRYDKLTKIAHVEVV
tara:strand:+ start:158 stop:370 length:213 start_codon:yes stop_codon:yes gene_type:complete